MHSINFTVCTFVEPCVRLVSLSSPVKADPSKPKYSNWYIFGYATDIAFRLGFIIFSVGQIALVNSQGVKSTQSLAYDASWMKHLAVLQLLLIPTFAIWRHFAVIDD